MKRKPDIYIGQELQKLTNPDYEDCTIHLLCLKGSISFLYHGSKYEMKANDLAVLLKPEFLSDLQGSEDMEMEHVTFQSDFIQRILPRLNFGIEGRPSIFANPIMSLDDKEMEHLKESISHLKSRYQCEGENHFENELIGALSQAILYDYFSFHFKRTQNLDRKVTPSAIVKQFLEMAQSGSTKTHRNLKYYANELHVTERYLADTVKRHTGHKASEIIADATITLLTNLIRDTHLSFSEISDEMGFTSLSYFCRYVQKHLGKTPTQLKAMNK